ncbi:TPA: P fimbrial minor subunit PapH, partial [Escherichia coli]|nr:P fimbrial minor subunit PapH [Escherichia coli]
AWQIIDMGESPVRDLQNGFSGPERKFSLRLRNCEFNSQGGNLFSDSRIRVTFDGVRGETPDKFNLSGQAKGINLQIADVRGNIARAGKVMPAIPLTGNEEALDYTLRIVRNGKKLEAGNYFAVLGFRVDYE